MEKFHNLLSELIFTSFCDSLTLQGESSVYFRLKNSCHSNPIEEVFRIYETDSSMILSDNGRTLANLDNIFELNEPDVIRNIIAILKQFNISKEGNAFTYKIDPSKDAIPQIIHFLQGINFLYAMKLFYM